MPQLPQPIRLPVYDWALPTQHLARVRAEIEATRHVYPHGAENAIICHIRPLEHRYEAGERSPELYEAMLAVQFRA